MEIFLSSSETPLPYVNIEVNCLGAVLLQSHAAAPRQGEAVDPAIWDSKLERWSSVDASKLSASDPPGPFSWTVCLRLPFALLHELLGLPPRPTEASSAAAYRMGLFKCADDSPRPHWAAWAPIGERLDFHQPDKFGQLVLAHAAEVAGR